MKRGRRKAAKRQSRIDRAIPLVGEFLAVMLTTKQRSLMPRAAWAAKRVLARGRE